MDVCVRNSTKIYSLSNGPNIPEWLGERARRNLSKRDSSIRRRIELLQDFTMPVASSKLMMSKDGKYIMAAGTYAPRIRCFELSELSMKFERYLDAEVVDMLFLGEDYGKLAMLLNDRSVAFHAPYGHHTSLRIPTFGRGMAYEPTNCELLISCSGKAAKSSMSQTRGGGEIYRINLQEGRFSAPLTYATSTKSHNDTSAAIGGNCITVSPTHALLALGCEDGIVRFWDSRASSAQDDILISPFCTLDVTSSTRGFGYYAGNDLILNNPHEISSIAFDSSGLYMAAGTKGGIVALYDVRSSKPLHVKEHQYGLPIHTVRFHAGSGTVLSGDSKLIKIWRSKPSATSSSNIALDATDFDDVFDKNNNSLGSIVANIEGKGDFTSFIIGGDGNDPSGNSSGLVLCTGETQKIQSFYCPILGTAPRWCSFLDNITEELEEKDIKDHFDSSNIGGDSAVHITGQVGGTVYEDYKFLTQSDIDKLGIQNLVGTPLLRGYMHGFFIDIGLYNRIRAVANPFEYEEYRKKKIRDKIEEKRASRIAPKNVKASTVNADLVERLERKAEDKNKAAQVAKSILTDNRFGLLFKNPDFQIDEEDENFKLRNPSGVKDSKEYKDDDMDSDRDDDSDVGDEGFYKRFKPAIDNAEGSADDEWGVSDDNVSRNSTASYSSDEDGFRGAKVRGENYDTLKKLKDENKRQKKIDSEKMETNAGGKKQRVTKKNIVYEPDDYADGEMNDAIVRAGLGDSSATAKVQKRWREETNVPIADRVQKIKEKNDYLIHHVKKGETMSREISYVPKKDRSKEETKVADKKIEEKNLDDRTKQRRGIKELKLKPLKF